MSRKDLDLKKIFFPESIDLDESSRLLQQTFYTQPALFILEYAMARYWLELGLNPRYLLGHSLGEYTAACISGVFTLEDALCLVTDRGRLMQSAPEGSMLSIPLSQNEIEAFLDSDKLQISVKNSPNRCVVSGTNEAIERLRIRLEGDGIRSSILKTSHAYHSFMMDSILDDFSQCFSGVSFSPPKIPVISNLTGDILSEAEITSKEYWINQLRLPVDFEAGVSRLLSHDNITLLEIGPGNTLCTLARSHDDISRENLCVPSVRNPKQRQDDYTFLLTAIGRLWQYGHSINWAALFKDVKKPRFIRIPTYSFSHEEYWIEEYSTVSWNNSLPNEGSDTRENELSLEDRVLNVWNEVFGMDNIRLDDNFYDLGGHSVLATQLLLLLNETFDSAISLGSLLMEPTPANSLQVISKDISIKYKNNESLPQKHNLPILFPVQKGNKDCTNLFMVAGLYANRYYYSETEGQKEYEEDYFRYFSTLVKDIGPDQPIYGFRPKGLFLNEKFHKNVKEMAREYVDALKIIQPEGPYFIGGECVGGIVAYEIAHRLILEGDEVSHLLLMDTMHPKTHSLRMHFLKKVKRTIIDYIKGPFRLHRSIKGFCKSLASLQEILLPITKKQYALRRVKFGNLIYLYKLLRYAPKEMDTDITILANKHWLKTKDSTLGWAKNSKIECKLVEIPGDHVTRLTTHGKVTGGHIRKIIDNLSLNRMDAS